MDIQAAILGGGALESLADQLGISRDSARMGAAALLPSILGGFKRDALARDGGLGGLIGGLEQLGGGALAEQVARPGPTDPTPGNEILGEIFGSKDVSRAVATHAGNQIGVDPGMLKRMLPLLAMLVAGYLATRGRAETVPADGGAAEAAEGRGLGSLLGGLFGFGGNRNSGQPGEGLGGLGAMLDMDGDGNPLDDILGTLGGIGRR